MSAGATYEAVLFDLDGTLVDTAPDMVAALLALMQAEGRKPLPYALARSFVSNGAAGLIGLAFPDVPRNEHDRLRHDFLDRYQAAVCVHSRLFPGLEEVLRRLDAGGVPWGVVTNKPGHLSRALLDGLGLHDRAACLVAGDTIPERKPDPAPLLLASRQTGVDPGRSVYVGDAARDIEAGKRAGMHTIAAAYGYVTGDDDPVRWDAHQIAADTAELAHLLLKGVNLDA
ncbi:MAG: HAD-IA family hydrolase [Gammaproteobacteria bacterium]|nr:HAD-IA family hydrolase [Gammaproteobacteria bacterium]